MNPLRQIPVALHDYCAFIRPNNLKAPPVFIFLYYYRAPSKNVIAKSNSDEPPDSWDNDELHEMSLPKEIIIRREEYKT